MANSNSSRDIHSLIYHKLFDVIPDLLTIEVAGKSKVEGLMDLNFDILHRRPDRIIIARSHYWKHGSGDMLADPDMEIAVYPKQEIAEALAYQDYLSYRRVYGEDNMTEDTKYKHELNAFLNYWLTNLLTQGHCIKTLAEQ